MTFVDYAEFIWKHDGTQQEVAGVLGWSVSKVKDYSALKKICGEAWEEIVAVFDNDKKSLQDIVATGKVAVATFTERLLRQIIQLTPDQQLELVTDLAANPERKGRFNTLAKKYAQQNADKKALIEALPNIGEDLMAEGIAVLRVFFRV